MKKGHIIAIVVVALVLIGAVVAYFLLTQEDNSGKKKSKNKYIVSTSETGLNVRMEPDVTAEKITTIDKGSEVEIVEIKNNFGRLSSGGWVSMDYLTKA